MSEGLIDLGAILVVWIFVMAMGCSPRKSDSPNLRLAKNIMRGTFTVTLCLVVLMALWVLYVEKTR